nr:MAG TPA: protein of unknown function (DUF5447) [Caudoviricetes sp.]DAS42735.1 MAG TPA: protein of unknown function (DUF5447) [Caudoviricetes sp.]
MHSLRKITIPIPPKYWYVNIIHCIPLFWQLKN